MTAVWLLLAAAIVGVAVWAVMTGRLARFGVGTERKADGTPAPASRPAFISKYTSGAL